MDNNTIPLVTICIPNYNSSDYLAETLESLSKQIYPNVEYILVDNCSTDDSVEIAKTYLDKIKNFQIVVNEKNIGGATFNKCLSLGTGKYIAIYHSDDIFTPQIIEECVKVLEGDGNVGAVSTTGLVINSKSEPTGKRIQIPEILLERDEYKYKFDDLFRTILQINGNFFLICPSVMMRRSVIEELGNFEYKTFAAAGDLGLWLKMAKHYKFAIINDPLIHYRIHDKQGSQHLVRECTHISDILRVMKFYFKESKQEEFRTDYNIFKAKQLLTLLVKRVAFGEKSYNKSLLKIAGNTLKQIPLSATYIKLSILWILVKSDLTTKIPFFSKTIAKVKRVKDYLC